MAHDFSHEEYTKQVRSVWIATVWLTVITIVEVVAALLWLEYMPEDAGKGLLNFGFIIMSLLKAYFIVGEFMHVRYEKRALMLTILGPCFFLIWFIIAFLWEGAEWLNMKELWGAL